MLELSSLMAACAARDLDRRHTRSNTSGDGDGPLWMDHRSSLSWPKLSARLTYEHPVEVTITFVQSEIAQVYFVLPSGVASVRSHHMVGD